MNGNDTVHLTIAFTAEDHKGKRIGGEVEVKFSGPMAALLDANMGNPLNQAYQACLAAVREELRKR
jgi:hypothetical protein